MTQALTIQADPALTFKDAIALRENALALSGLIARVACAEEQQLAVDAQKALVTFRRLIEQMRVTGKAPALKFCQMIDGEAKKLVEEAESEERRVTKLVADFQALELAKVRAARAAENERLSQLERERFVAAAEAKSHEQLEAVHAEFEQRVANVNPPIVPARVQGQIVREEWEFTILDVWALAQNHPECVKAPEVYRAKVKALLDSGIKPVGVRAWKAVKAGVNLT